jgi:hypothetical protein
LPSDYREQAFANWCLKDVPCACVLYAYIGLFVRDDQARTIRLETDSWANISWGVHDVERGRQWGTVAIFSDGSRANIGESVRFRQLAYGPLTPFLVRIGKVRIR